MTHTLISPSVNSQKLKLEQPVKLGMMASGSGTNFEVVAKAIASGELNAQIPILVYNNPHAKVASRAKRLGIPSKLLNHRDYRRREDLDRAIVETMQEHQVDLIVMVGWMRIVTKVLLETFPNRVINIHPSLLPSFKGVKAVEKALQAQVKITGCTVHFACLEVDSGPILMQAAVPILDDDTSENLHARIQEQEHVILPQAIALAAQQYFST